MTRDYCGAYTYRNGTIERIMMGCGFIQDSVYYVQIKDYQGNVRAVLDQDHNLVERNEYYPYGGLINASDSQLQPYKYSAKELDRENGLDWYDSQARWYDPMLPLTTTQDPLAEKYYYISPYAWCAGNPVRFVDPDGMKYLDKNDIYFVFNMLASSIIRSNELEQQISNTKNKKETASLSEQKEEVDKSIQDLCDMWKCEDKIFHFEDSKNNGNKNETKKVNGVYTMYVENNRNSSKSHEMRHGGQNARNEWDFMPSGEPDNRFGASHEVSAYRAEFAYDGFLHYMPFVDLSDAVSFLKYSYTPESFLKKH